MANLNDSRELQKERLRQNMITNHDTGEDDAKRPSPVVFIVIILFVAAVAFTALFGRNLTQSTDYTIVWSKNIEGGSEVGAVEVFKGYQSFNGGIIRYSKDGAEYIDERGNVVWERSYQLGVPVVDVCGSYAVIGDRGGTQIYIFDSTKMTGSVETVLPISLLRAAGNGVVYAVLNDSGAEYITAFRQDGAAIDLSVKSVLSGDGYPFDMDVSPDGTQLITSYIGIEDGQISNNVVFRNFSSIGQNEDARRIVGGFKDEFAGHMTGYVHFATDEYSQAFYDGGVVFFTTAVLNSPEILGAASFEDKMESVACSEDISVVITMGEGNDAARMMHIYNNKGALLSETELGERYTDICASSDNVLLRSGSSVRVYSKGGALNASLEFAEGELIKICECKTDREVYAVTSSDIYKLRF